jgi:hypothetical protein
MPILQKKKPREDEVDDTLQSSAEVQEEAANVLREVASRLDRLSAEMRKHGAFPIAGQLERERDEIQGRVNGITS